MGAGALAGCLGALLGLGGGVFLVPFLNAALGLDFKTAAAISLVTVIATSSAVSAGTLGLNLINLRLGMLLEVASAAGGVAAGDHGRPGSPTWRWSAASPSSPRSSPS